jgi:hypothetical protein
MQVLRLPNCRELEKGANRVVGDAACKMSLPKTVGAHCELAFDK